MKEAALLKVKVVAAKDQVSADLSGEVVVLNFKNGVYYGLDSVGTRVWNLIQKPTKMDEITSCLAKEYNVEPKECQRDVLGLVKGLLAEGLIEIKDGVD